MEKLIAIYIIEKIFDNFEVALEQCKLESEREVFKLNIKSVSIFNKASGEYYYSAEIGLRATDLEIMDIHYGIDNYEKYGMLMGVFGGLWFDFPTPFKVGDIVRNVNRPRQPLVLYRVGFDDMENQFFNREYNNDEKDMAYGACYPLDDGSVISDLEWNYMDLEYYTGELEEEKKVLKPISYFLKDEIDIALCVNAINVLGKRLAVEQSIPLGYTEDILVKLGISNKEG